VTEHYEWRLEVYQDAEDPFGAIQFYVMQGAIMLAQCDVESHASLIVSERQRLRHFQQALERIAAMSPQSHELQAAVLAATEALREGG
jgi:hypothetical protein